jgi:hypothetical protein
LPKKNLSEAKILLRILNSLDIFALGCAPKVLHAVHIELKHNFFSKGNLPDARKERKNGYENEKDERCRPGNAAVPERALGNKGKNHGSN